MSLLCSLRNLAVLVILTVAVLGLTSRPVPAQSSCRPPGSYCHLFGVDHECCNNWCYLSRCCWAIPGHSCTSGLQCCSGTCVQGRCH
jgi:hypothetical protein